MVGYQGARLIPELEEACAAGRLVTSYIPTTYDTYMILMELDGDAYDHYVY